MQQKHFYEGKMSTAKNKENLKQSNFITQGSRKRTTQPKISRKKEINIKSK